MLSSEPFMYIILCSLTSLSYYVRIFCVSFQIMEILISFLYMLVSFWILIAYVVVVNYCRFRQVSPLSSSGAWYKKEDNTSTLAQHNTETGYTINHKPVDSSHHLAHCWMKKMNIGSSENIQITIFLEHKG